MDDRIVIPITDQNYLELIRELENLLDQIMATNERSLIRYCKYVETIPTEYYRSSFILIWREAIELVDSIKSLVALSSCNTIPILLRSLFELNLGIAFICSDENKIKQRALAYGGISLIRRIENYKKFDPTNLEYMEFRDCIGIDIVSKFDKDFDYKGATDNLSSIFEKYPAYKEFKEEYDRIFEQKKQCGRKQVRPEWYELFDGKSSIFSLAEMLGRFTRNYTQTVKRAADNKRRYAPGKGHSACLLWGYPKGVTPHLAHDFAKESVVCYTLCRRCRENAVAAGEGKGI